MTRIRDEVPAHLLDALALGDVPDHEEREPGRDPRRPHHDQPRLGRWRAAAKAQRGCGGAVRGAGGARHGAQLVGGKHGALVQPERQRPRRMPHGR